MQADRMSTKRTGNSATVTAEETSPHATGMNGAVVRQIKLARLDAGLTIGDLAELAGLNTRSLLRYLGYERALTLGVTEALANALGMTYETLVQRAWAQRK